MKPARMSRRSINLCAVASAVLLLALPAAAPAQTANAKGKISRNFYRIPYENGSTPTINFDYVDHGNTPAGDTGSMDVRDGTVGVAIVAAAAGEVIAVNDTRSGCGCSSAFGPCANSIRIRHANGEVSTYLHIAQNSATSRGIAVGVNVTRGQEIAVEGDIGWTCGGDRDPVGSTCSGGVPSGTGDCGRHLHWNVVRESTNERVNPMTCGISNSIYVDDTTYTAAACTAVGCVANLSFSAVAFNAFGVFRVYQATDTINVVNPMTIGNFASVVLHAGNKVRLGPGFKVTANGYFRAEIGSCNQTAQNP